MQHDLEHYLDQVPKDTRTLAEFMLRQNQSDKKEVSGLISAQNHTLDDIRKDVADTLEQTRKTNGRVTKLERWQAYVFGFCACLTLLIVPILLALIINYAS